MTLQILSQLLRRVENLARARAFFANLSIAELYSFPGLCFLSLGATRLMLKQTGQRDAADILYFQVAEIHAAHADLTAKGIIFPQPPQMIHRHPDGREEWMAFFKDDEGRDMALHALQEPVQAS